MPRLAIAPRKRSKRKLVRPDVKSRSVSVYRGKHKPDRTYNASSGMTYAGPNYPEFPKRTNAESAVKAFHDARISQYTTAQIAECEYYGEESIASTSGSKGDMHNCTHIKIGGYNVPWLIIHSYKGRYYYFDYFRFGLPNVYYRYLTQEVYSLHLQYQPGHDRLFSGRAYWSMRPKFEGKVSIINSIFELKDFKDVLRIGKIVGKFKKALRGPDFNKGYKHVSKALNTATKSGIGNHGGLNLETLKRVSHDSTGAIAAGILAYNLAIKPTISDILAITEQLATEVKDAEEQFALSGDDGSLSHYSERTLISSPTVSTDPVNYWTANGKHCEVLQTATMRSFYEYKARSMADVLCRYWGMYGTIDAVWNMLPLSFVLDYALTIGKALNFMDRDNNVFNLTTEYCESVKISNNYGMHIVQSSSTPGLVIDGQWKLPTSGPKYHLVSGTRCKRYQRTVMDPYKGPALPRIKMPSTSQSINMLALVRCFMN